jgi:hypothetical protein
MESRKTFNTNIVYDILSFPTDIYTPSSDQQFRSDDHYNSGGGGVLKIISGQIKLSGQIWTLRSLQLENWKTHEYKGHREFYNLSNEG